ncbi:hypothetical protein GE061_006155 [Apolygus lucorum]|uniref:Uncharacterized protein n=1 Tax=Apolygus lucorum TaxID=248454 RepID=A0A8S9WT68_APOLU|nr:hypothetical protein GE061_006155 [Apolygus lucorum]
MRRKGEVRRLNCRNPPPGALASLRVRNIQERLRPRCCASQFPSIRDVLISPSSSRGQIPFYRSRLAFFFQRNFLRHPFLTVFHFRILLPVYRNLCDVPLVKWIQCGRSRDITVRAARVDHHHKQPETHGVKMGPDWLGGPWP